MVLFVNYFIEIASPQIPITNIIHERPEAAIKRTEFGHWETDIVIRKAGQSCLVTLIDRKSRFLIASKATKKILNQ